MAACALAALALGATASAETVQRGGVRVQVDGEIAPKRLPRHGSAPVRVSVVTRIAALGGAPQPKLRRVTIEINRHGSISGAGLPACRLSDIQPATTAKALAACRASLVGKGTFAADVSLGSRVRMPSSGALHAFYGRYKGKPAILGHVYGRTPVPSSVTLVFVISERRKGRFGTVLTAQMPGAGGSAVTGMTLRLDRVLKRGGKRRGFVSAGCPAPRGFPGATFPLVRTRLDFAGGRTVSTTVSRQCRARG